MYKLFTALLIILGFSLQAQPSLKGGLDNYLQNNKIYPNYSLANCITGVVNVAFKLNAKGFVYYSEVRNGVGTDLDNEALRLIRMSSGKWIVPADHDSSTVIFAPINFKLTDCDGRNTQEVKAAIEAYKANIDLTNAVLNFYRAKEQGKAPGISEVKALELKDALGYDDSYLAQRLQNGKKKLKQNDKQGACEDFKFVRYMGSNAADELLNQYCK